MTGPIDGTVTHAAPKTESKAKPRMILENVIEHPHFIAHVAEVIAWLHTNYTTRPPRSGGGDGLSEYLRWNQINQPTLNAANRIAPIHMFTYMRPISLSPREKKNPTSAPAGRLSN